MNEYFPILKIWKSENWMPHN